MDSSVDPGATFRASATGSAHRPLTAPQQLNASQSALNASFKSFASPLDDYPSTTLDLLKYAIFVVDCAKALVMVKSKPESLEELKFRCVEAMGLRAPDESVRMELIFAGYDGPRREPLGTDDQLEAFLNTLPQDHEGQSKGDAAVQAALAQQREEYEKKLRALQRQLDDMTEEAERLQARNNELEAEALAMHEQLRVRLEQAEVDIEKRCRKAFKKELAEHERVWGERIEELKRKLGELHSKYVAEQERADALEVECEAQKKRIEELEVDKERLEARGAQLEPFVAKCDQLQSEVDLWKKRYEQLLRECEREDDPPKDADSSSFEWAIPAMTSKLRYPKGRMVQSPEFNIAGLKEPVQVEFFPKGDSSSWDGWCAVKLRVPDETQLVWSCWVGSCRQGPRLDVFDQNNWWCRQGLLWSNFCLQLDAKRQIDDADNLICGIEVHAVGPFARDPEHPLADPSQPSHPLPLRPSSTASVHGGHGATAQRSARTGSAPVQWQAYGFLEMDDEDDFAQASSPVRELRSRDGWKSPQKRSGPGRLATPLASPGQDLDKVWGMPMHQTLS